MNPFGNYQDKKQNIQPNVSSAVYSFMANHYLNLCSNTN